MLNKYTVGNLTIVEAPYPRRSWRAQHHMPHPLWIRDLTRGIALKIHLPPVETEWSKQVNWEVVGIGGVKTKPIEFISGEPYKINFEFHLICENQWPVSQVIGDNVKKIFNDDQAANWKIAEDTAKNFYGTELTGKFGNFRGDQQNIQEFLVELKKLASNQLRIVKAGSYFTDSHSIASDDLKDIGTGNIQLEAYDVVMTNLAFTIKQRDEIMNFPTYALVKMEFLQR